NAVAWLADGRPVTSSNYVLLVLAPRASGTYPLPARGRIVIGRAPDADVQIDDPSISRHHAALHVGPGFQLADLGSANGTRVHDPPTVGARAETARTSGGALALEPSQPIEVVPGMILQLGSAVALVRTADEAAAASRYTPTGGGPASELPRDPKMQEVVRMA